MSRHPQWEPRLLALVEKHRSTPYQWGKWDCLLFAAAVAKAVTGKDHAKGHRGQYDSFASAYAYLKRLGFDSPEALLDSLFDEKPVGFAQRGDLVLCDLSPVEHETSPPGPVPGVCMGAAALCLVAEHQSIGSAQGLVQVPRERWVKAWAVGDHFGGEF
jgi:hypothetical protein